MYEHSLLYYAVFSQKKLLEMLSDEKIEKCNSFLVSLFIFCFLNIIIRAFFRDINCTLSLVPRRSLLPRCPREVWERAGVYLSVTSQLAVESSINRAENAQGLGCCTLKKELFYQSKTMHLGTIYEAPVRSINTIITTLGVCVYNALEVCQV